MTSLEKLLNAYRQASVTEREKGTYFEELIACYLRNEATYRDLSPMNCATPPPRSRHGWPQKWQIATTTNT